MSLEAFKHSKCGAEIGQLLAQAALVDMMKDLSRRGVPAVAALDANLPPRFRLGKTERQLTGRWIKEVLADHGWQPALQRRIHDGRVFASGSVYRPAKTNGADPLGQIPSALAPARERLARAQALVAAFSKNDYGVDDYLRDKWAEAAVENAEK